MSEDTLSPDNLIHIGGIDMEDAATEFQHTRLCSRRESMWDGDDPTCVKGHVEAELGCVLIVPRCSAYIEPHESLPLSCG